MNDDRSFWVVRRADEARAQAEDAIARWDVAIAESRRALEWIGERLSELRRERETRKRSAS